MQAFKRRRARRSNTQTKALISESNVSLGRSGVSEPRQSADLLTQPSDDTLNFEPYDLSTAYSNLQEWQLIPDTHIPLPSTEYPIMDGSTPMAMNWDPSHNQAVLPPDLDFLSQLGDWGLELSGPVTTFANVCDSAQRSSHSLHLETQSATTFGSQNEVQKTPGSTTSTPETLGSCPHDTSSSGASENPISKTENAAIDFRHHLAVKYGPLMPLVDSLVDESWRNSFSISSPIISRFSMSVRHLSSVSFMSRSSKAKVNESNNDDSHHANSIAHETQSTLLERLEERMSLFKPIPSTPVKPVSNWPSALASSFSGRNCCSETFTGLPAKCQKCGMTSGHRVAISTCMDEQQRVIRIVDGTFGCKDNFDNTVLHFAAARAEVPISALNNLINLACDESLGVDINSQNTMGQTFMHVLADREQTSDADFCQLILALRERKFRFSARDHRGSSLARTLRLNMYAVTQAFVSKADMLNNMAVDTYVASDNLGNSTGFKDVFEHYMGWDNPGNFWREYGETPLRQNEVLGVTVTDLTLRYDTNTNFRQLLKTDDLESEELRKADGSHILWKDYCDWVDINGDTLLLACLKSTHNANVLTREVSLLIHLGVAVNAQDRRGNTALGIASVRGLRVIVEKLLDAGANPNARNYHGASVLTRATKRMILASKEDDIDRYANILTCQSLLIDAGAVQEPSEWLEWSSKSAREYSLHLYLEERDRQGGESISEDRTRYATPVWQKFRSI